MKTSNTARTVALAIAILLNLVAIDLMADYALPADAPVQVATGTHR